MRRVALALVLMWTLLAGAACDQLPAPGTGGGGSPIASGPPVPAAATSRTQLAALVVAPPRAMTGYSRARFPHWKQGREGCDTRETVLRRDGQNVVVSGTCAATSGRWFSVYDNTWQTSRDQVDIDHVVALANAWRSGADSWTDAQREQFANDVTNPQLLAVSRESNRSKGDQDPSQWRPPNRASWCDYARRWIAVKHVWKLTVTAAEKTALTDMLGTCR